VFSIRAREARNRVARPRADSSATCQSYRDLTETVYRASSIVNGTRNWIPFRVCGLLNAGRVLAGSHFAMQNSHALTRAELHPELPHGIWLARDANPGSPRVHFRKIAPHLPDAWRDNGQRACSTTQSGREADSSSLRGAAVDASLPRYRLRRFSS
jgi:hypothetical protein